MEAIDAFLAPLGGTRQKVGAINGIQVSFSEPHLALTGRRQLSGSKVFIKLSTLALSFSYASGISFLSFFATSSGRPLVSTKATLSFRYSLGRSASLENRNGMSNVPASELCVAD